MPAPIPPLPPTGIPEPQEAIVGYWEGAYSWAGARVKIWVHFETDEEGLKATIDIPEQNIMGLALFNVSYDPPRVHFKIQEFSGIFDGELKDDTIDGELVQSGVLGRFTLERVEAETEAFITYPWPTSPFWLAQATPKPSVTDTIVQEGDLVLGGDEVLELSDVRLVLKGNLVVRDRASFKATNVILEQHQEYNNQYGIKVQDDATFELQNVFIDSGGPWLRINFMGSSQVSLRKVWGQVPGIPGYTTQDNARVSIQDSVVGMTPFTDFTGSISIKGSSIWLELSIPETGRIDVNLPWGFTPTWHFPSSEDSGVPYKIQAEDTWFRLWAIALAPGAQVTVRDTEAVNFLFLVGLTWSGAVVELRDLKPGFVEDRTWEVDGAVLRVVNTYVNEWYPGAWGNAELTLIDSKVNEVEPSGQARVIIRNSRVSVIHASNQVEMWVYDSSVDLDVIAYDEAVIHLFNTSVGRKINAADEGKVYVDGEPFESLPGVRSGLTFTVNGSITDASEEVIGGIYSIKGSYTGSDSYNAYLQTVPSKLPLSPEQTYRVTFDYRILSTPDKGFETLFYSPKGGSEGKWLPSITITGQAGDSGSATLTSTLLNYPDYKVVWNVVGTGAIAIDNIQIVNLTTGETIAAEDLER